MFAEFVRSAATKLLQPGDEVNPHSHLFLVVATCVLAYFSNRGHAALNDVDG